MYSIKIVAQASCLQKNVTQVLDQPMLGFDLILKPEKYMKKFFLTCLALMICSFFLCSCKEDESLKQKHEAEKQKLQQELQVQKQLKENAVKENEKAQQQVVKTYSKLYIAISFAIVFIFIAIIYGILIGAKAKKDVTKIEKEISNEVIAKV